MVFQYIWFLIETLVSLLNFGHASKKFLAPNLSFKTTYHPQTDGQFERIIQNLEDMLRVCVLDFKGSWDIYLPLAEFAYNNSFHSIIEMTPYKVLYGRSCRSLTC